MKVNNTGVQLFSPRLSIRGTNGKVIFPITQNFLIKGCKALLEEEEEAMLLSVHPSPVITPSWGKRKKEQVSSVIYIATGC